MMTPTFWQQFGTPISVIVVGAIILAAMRLMFNGLILELEERFVTVKSCIQCSKQSAEERESLRKEDEKSDERITYLERHTVKS
jgi:hypothetical protein